MLFVPPPPDFGQLVTCCVMNHSAVQRCQASQIALQLTAWFPLWDDTHYSLVPLRPHTAVLFRRDVNASAFCRRVVTRQLSTGGERRQLVAESVIVMMYTDKLCYTSWFHPADCTVTVILSYSRNPVRTVMIPSIRDTSRGPGTVARDTATIQQHATKSARIQK